MTYAALYDNKPSYTNLRKKLRRRSTKAEQIFWQEVRAKKLGFVIRRQYQVGYYVVDFYCHERKIIIEIDGPIHEEEYQKKHDQKRTKWLESQGYTIIRFQNDEVIFEREKVLERMQNILHQNI